MKSSLAAIPGAAQAHQTRREASTHRDAMKSGLAAIPGAAQAHQTRREASTHRDAMKSSLAAIPGVAQAHQTRSEASSAHRDAMKSTLARIPTERASKTIGHFVSAKMGAQKTKRNMTARMEYNQSAAGKAALAADVATMRQIKAGGPSITQRGLFQSGRHLLGKVSASAHDKANMIDEQNNQAGRLAGTFGENKATNQAAQHHINMAEHRETAAIVLDKVAAPLGMAVSAVATPAAGLAASAASSVASAGASYFAANQRGKAGALLDASAHDRKKGGESLQKEISFMRGRGERKLESQDRGQSQTTGAGLGVNLAAKAVDPTGIVGQVALAGVQKAANRFVAGKINETAVKHGHDEHQTDLNLQNQYKSLQAASKHHDKTAMGREAMHARPNDAPRIHTPARKWPTVKVRGGGGAAQ